MGQKLYQCPYIQAGLQGAGTMFLKTVGGLGVCHKALHGGQAGESDLGLKPEM